MKSERDRSKERLIHIADAIEKIENYVDGMAEQEFYRDARSNEAILFQLSIIGEAIIHVDYTILEKYNYPWHEVRGLRNVIVHEYFGIKMDKIWSIIQFDLLNLKMRVTSILETEF